MKSNIIDKYMNEGLAKGDADHIIYQFTNAIDDIEQIFGDIEITMDDYVDKYGENADLKKVFYKNSDAVTKALNNFEKKVIVPFKKIYK